ncbi:hypothetical protein ABK040_006848 [Willaertia magna]
MFRNTDQELKEKLAVDRRRYLEEERKKRIFDPKVRTMGIDKDGIERQIEEKQILKQMEEEREQFYDQYTLTNTKLANFYEKQQNQAKRRVQEGVNDFRLNNQKFETRREFDLNDPESLKKDRPARLGDYDPRLTISGGQIMHGEDLGYSDRVKAQKEQLKNWIEEQTLEKKLKQEKEELEKLLEEAKQFEIQQITFELQKKETQLRAQQERMRKEYNIEQAIEKKERERFMKEKEEIAKLEEIQNTLNDDFLNETFETTFNVTNPTRFKPDHFKSLRQDQYEEIERTRQMQLEESKAKKELEKTENQYWDTQRLLNSKLTLKAQREQERMKRQQARELFELHKQQAVEKEQKQKNINRAYENQVTEDFFNQFNTTSR